MHQTSTISFMSQARVCIMEIRSNVTFIKGEFPSVELPDDLRSKAEMGFNALDGACYDVSTELSELGDLLDEPQQDAAAIDRYTKRILDWLSEPIRKMDELTKAIQSAADNDGKYDITFTLFAESFMNILASYRATVHSAGADYSEWENKARRQDWVQNHASHPRS